mgnify:CR=1 FL=1|jgi:hypothetical protein
MKRLFLSFFLMVTLLSSTESTASDVYAKVMQIDKEVNLIKVHFGLSKEADSKLLNINFEPRHTWQQTYEIFVKINIFRRAHNLATIEPVNLEPLLNVAPTLTYEQTLRLLEEFRILKYRLGITTKVSKIREYHGKKPKDVYALLEKISQEIDILNGSGFTPSYVFAQTMRVYDDVNIILAHLNIKDETIPASKKIGAKPIDTFNTAMLLLKSIRQIKGFVGISSIDFNALHKESITPSDVFAITVMIIGELQIIKSYIGVKEITPSARHYFDKSPADVDQLMSWNLRKLKLITTLSRAQ